MRFVIGKVVLGQEFCKYCCWRLSIPGHSNPLPMTLHNFYHWLNDGKLKTFFRRFFLYLFHKIILTHLLLSASSLQHIVTLIEGRIEFIIFWNCPTHFNKYLWIYTRVHLEMIEWVFDVVNVKVNVNLLVDTSDISFFII